MRFDLFTHPLGERHSGVEHRARKQQHELLPAISPHPVYLAYFVAQDARELLEHRVARLVPIGVVDTLEPVQVAHDAREGLCQPLGVLEHLQEALFEIATVIEPRQAIGL